MNIRDFTFLGQFEVSKLDQKISLKTLNDIMSLLLENWFTLQPYSGCKYLCASSTLWSRFIGNKILNMIYCKSVITIKNYRQFSGKMRDNFTLLTVFKNTKTFKINVPKLLWFTSDALLILKPKKDFNGILTISLFFRPI